MKRSMMKKRNCRRMGQQNNQMDQYQPKNQENTCTQKVMRVRCCGRVLSHQGKLADGQGRHKRKGRCNHAHAMS